jgi:hypothetical protein
MPCTGRWKLSPPQPWARLRMLFHLPARLNRRLICFPLGLTLFDSPPHSWDGGKSRAGGGAAVT